MKKWISNNRALVVVCGLFAAVCIYLVSGTAILGASVGGAPVTMPSSPSAPVSAETTSTTTDSNEEAAKKVYVVKKNETLWEIAQDTKVSVQTLMTVNQLNSSIIFEGQELVISTNK